MFRLNKILLVVSNPCCKGQFSFGATLLYPIAIDPITIDPMAIGLKTPSISQK
jgi:hypothetical protein